MYAEAVYYGLPINDLVSSKTTAYTDAIAMVFVAPLISSLPDPDKCSYITIPNDEIVALFRKVSSK